MTREKLYYKPCSTCHNHDCVFVGKEDTHEVCEDYQTIKALEQEPTTKNDLGVDCISRADARSLICKIDIKHHMRMSRKTFKDLYNGMDELPSVTPQEPQSFKWCTDCKEYDQEKHCCHRYSKVIRDTVEMMKQEPKTGHWNNICDKNLHDYRTGNKLCYQCSECKSQYTFKYSFCPNCGSDNRDVEI